MLASTMRILRISRCHSGLGGPLKDTSTATLTSALLPAASRPMSGSLLLYGNGFDEEGLDLCMLSNVGVCEDRRRTAFRVFLLILLFLMLTI